MSTASVQIEVLMNIMLTWVLAKMQKIQKKRANIYKLIKPQLAMQAL